MHVSAQVIERISKNWIDYHSEYVTQVLMHSFELILFKNMNLNSESSKVWYGAHHHKSAQYTAFTQIHKTTQIRYEYVVYTEKKKTQLLSLAALLIFRKHSNKCCVDCFWFAVFIDRFVYVHCESIVNAQAHIAMLAIYAHLVCI